MKVGRPLKYKTPEELQEAIDKYFDETLKVEKTESGYKYVDAPTVSGLAFHLGFESRQSMYDYEGRDEFSYTIKRAVTRIEIIHEKNLLSTGASGSIFWLKNRGWTDKTIQEHSGQVTQLIMPKFVMNEPTDSDKPD